MRWLSLWYLAISGAAHFSLLFAHPLQHAMCFYKRSSSTKLPQRKGSCCCWANPEELLQAAGMVLLRNKQVNFQGGDRNLLLLQRDYREKAIVSQGLKGKTKTLIRKSAELDANVACHCCVGAMLRANIFLA